MTEPTFHLRAESDFGTPTNTTGSARPLLRMGLPWLTVHYSGVMPSQVSYSQDGVFMDDRSVALHMGNLERIARASGKPFEYNTIIPAMADPNAAHIWAYADEYQAAHSAGENADAYGVQFPNGVGQRLTPGQIRAFVWWHAVMVAAGRLAPMHAVMKHREMPGAATICPGPAIELDWTPLLAKYEPPAPDPIDTPEDDEMDRYRYKDSRYSNEWQMPECVALSGKMSERAQGLPLVEDTHDQALAALVERSWPSIGTRVPGAPPAQLIQLAAHAGYLV
jgi:hypothetical protein